MRDPRVLCKGFVPKQEELFHEAWKKCSWFLPRWVVEVNVVFQDIKTANFAECLCLQEYGLATIDIYPSFLLATKEQRVHVVLHEITHMHLWAITSLTKSLIKEAPRDARKHIALRLEENEERAVQEISFALEGLTASEADRPASSKRKKG